MFKACSNIISVIDLNSDLQASGNSLTSVMRKQIETQTTLENIDEAIDTLKVYLREIFSSDYGKKCLCVLGLANRIHELIEKKKSYAALRALDGILSLL